jgi:pimeloyl-ACP methyl ester carboxylesterase
MVTPTPLDFELDSGRISARRWGAPDAPLLVCVPGLSQDARSFDQLGSRLGSDQRQVVAISPRGRGGSQRTPPGSYGWPAHARDVAGVFSSLGKGECDVLGWSFGAFVTLQLAAQSPGLIRRAVLIDAVGRPEPSSLQPILAGLERLSVVFGSVQEYADRVLSGGAMGGCRDAWQSYLAEDLVPVPGGFRTRTDRDAVMEDAAYGAGHDPYQLWPALVMPVQLVRAARPILPGLGFLVSEADRDRFGREVSLSQVVEVDANHYCVGMAEETVRAVQRFLDE